MNGPIQAQLVCGGKWHDIDFARVELLKLLGEHPEIRTRARIFRPSSALRKLAVARLWLRFRALISAEISAPRSVRGSSATC